MKDGMASLKPNRVNSLIVEDMNTTNHPQGHADLLILTLTHEKEAVRLVPEGSTVAEAQDFIADYINKKYKEHGLVDVTVDEETKRSIKLRCDEKKCWSLTNLDAIIKGAKNMETFLGKSIGLYKGPTMFIYGTESHGQVYNDEKNILKLFPNAKLVGVEGAGHTIHGKHREFNDEVIKFLNSLKN